MKEEWRQLEKSTYLKSTGEKLMKDWDNPFSVEEKWNTFESALCGSAEKLLGHVDRNQPDWFRESEVNIKPLFAVRNRLYALWLATGSERDRERHAG